MKLPTTNDGKFEIKYKEEPKPASKNEEDTKTNDDEALKVGSAETHKKVSLKN